MSLRRSPRLTPVFLAANRANAQKSTGPRTAPGKQRSARDAFRTGSRTSTTFWTRGMPHREVAEFQCLARRHRPGAVGWHRTIPRRGRKVMVNVLARRGRQTPVRPERDPGGWSDPDARGPPGPRSRDHGSHLHRPSIVQSRA